MPKITFNTIGVALDMFGCPNRCRHCWLGPRPVAGRMTEDDLRWAVAQFRSFRKPGEQEPFFRSLRVSTWAREPDYSDEYRRLYELERELSDDETGRPDYVLSIWRLARDPDYAQWAHETGVRLCQLRFFGLEEATDWGYRRRGAFRDLLIATERLLAAGIRVRWRWYFTKKIIPDLPGLIALTEQLDLRRRCEALGGPFELWFLGLSPDGEAWNLEHLRPTAADLDKVPRWLLRQTEERTGGPIGQPEARLLPGLLEEPRPVLADPAYPASLWFHVVPGFDVYLNHFEITPAFRLGNLKSDGLAAIVDRYENDATVGLQSMYGVPVSDLARRFARPRSQRLYHPDDLKWRWAKMWVEAQCRPVQPWGRSVSPAQNGGGRTQRSRPTRLRPQCGGREGLVGA